MFPDRLHRSYLYAPGDRPDVMAKAKVAGADAVVFDLEDAVAPQAKDGARDLVARAIADGSPTRIDLHVRVNGSLSGFDDDLRAVVVPGLDAVRLPKVDDPDHVRAVDALIGELEEQRAIPSGHVRLYPLIESAAGLWRIEGIAKSSPRISRIDFGATDYLADVSAGEQAADHARQLLVVASRAFGVGPPIDSVHTKLDDDEGLRLAANRARELGMFGKSVIHPRQLTIVHRAFRPSNADVIWAENVVKAWKRAKAEGRGAIQVDGQFVDVCSARSRKPSPSTKGGIRVLRYPRISAAYLQ